LDKSRSSKSGESEAEPQFDVPFDKSSRDPFEEVRRDILERRAARQAEPMEEKGLEAEKSFNTGEEAAYPRETSSEEALTTLTKARGLRQGDDREGAMDSMPASSSTEVETSTPSMSLTPLTKARSKTVRTKPYARRSAQRAQCRSNQKMLRRIRGNFRNPESAKAALIAGEILAQPLALRPEGERRI